MGDGEMSRITITRAQILRCNPCARGLDSFDAAFPGVSQYKRFTIQQLLDAGIQPVDIVWATRCVAEVHHAKVRLAAKNFLPTEMYSSLTDRHISCVWLYISYYNYLPYLHKLMQLDEEQNAQ